MNISNPNFDHHGAAMHGEPQDFLVFGNDRRALEREDKASALHIRDLGSRAVVGSRTPEDGPRHEKSLDEAAKFYTRDFGPQKNKTPKHRG